MIRTCPSCGQKNRVPAARLADGARSGRCGKCKETFGPVDTPIDVEDARSFDEIVREAKVPVLVDFWAAWCGPCRMAAPEVQKAAKQMAGRALALKVDTEKLPDLAARFQVRGIPHFVVMNGGHVVVQQPGLVDHRQMMRWIDSAARTAA